VFDYHVGYSSYSEAFFNLLYLHMFALNMFAFEFLSIDF
jgi:hypothetical protein